MIRPAPWRAPSARGFTLVELTVVAIVMGILAVSVVPALRSMTDARAAAARREIVRRLADARDRAIGAGVPMGLRVAVDASTAQTVTIAPGGGAVTPAADALGNPSAAWSLSGAFPGVTFRSMTLGDGSAGSGAVWFGTDGTPETRSAAGVLGSAWTDDAEIELSTGASVFVRRGTGLVE